MKSIVENIWKEEEYSYRAAYGFRPNIHGYIHEENRDNRDCILVVPGGGYCMCAPHEGEIVAMTFYEMGLNAFVLTYTTDITMSVPLKLQPLNDISRAVRFIRSHSDEYLINDKKLFICGFSAGGHLCGSLCVHYNDVRDVDPKLNAYSNRPDGAILSYPVITTGEFTHIDSVHALCGMEPSEQDLDYFSVEKHVSPDTPSCFLWQTATDDAVPVENSYLMAKALKANGVKFAHYVYPEGRHGVGLCNMAYFNRESGGEYVMDQYHRVVDAVRSRNTVDVSDKRLNELLDQFDNEERMNQEPKPDMSSDPVTNRLISAISTWPKLAKDWMDGI